MDLPLNGFYDKWPILLSVIGLIVWIVRLEAMVQVLNRDHSSLAKKHDELDRQVLEELAYVRESLARIEGKLSVRAGKTNEIFS